MNKAICYIRVSTEEQVMSGVSLEAQEDRLKAYCKLQGLELVEIIRDEGISGSKVFETRPGGAKLLQMVDKHNIKNIVALKLDRLFRDAENALKQTKAWDKEGIALHLIDLGGQAINTSTAMGRFFLNMMAGFAELERNLIAERTKTALSYKKKNLEAYSPTPYGFSRDDKKLIPNHKEQTTISKIKMLHSKGLSLRKIATELNSTSIPSKTGGVWHPTTVNNILKNNIHAGVVV